MRLDPWRRLTLAVAAGLLVVASLHPASAQALKAPASLANPWVFDPADPTVLRLEGAIEPGAAEAFEAALARNPGVTTLVLRGDGTTLADTMAIASRVRELGLATRIEENEFCYLACGVVFLAGQQRVAAGILCVAVLFADTLDLEKAQLDLADFIELLVSLDLSPELLSSVVETASGGAYCFSPHEIARFGIDVPVRNAPAGWDAVPYAVLYEQPREDQPDGAPWPSHTVTTAWSLDDSAGTPVIRLVAEAPDAGMTVTVTIAADPPTTNRAARGTTVTLLTEPTLRFAGRRISNVNELLARDNEATAGIGGFDGARPTAHPGEYSIRIAGDVLSWGFSRVHFSRRWLSFILSYETGERAELLIEVGEEGRAVIDAAFAAWEAMPAIAPPPTAKTRAGR